MGEGANAFKDEQWEGEPIKSKGVSRATCMWGNSVAYSRGGTCVYVEMAGEGGVN